MKANGFIMKNPEFSLHIGADSRIISAEVAGGREYFPSLSVSFASLSSNGVITDSEAAFYDGERLVLSFPDRASLVLEVSSKPEAVCFTVESCPECDYIIFAKLPMDGMPLMGMALNPTTTGAAWVTDPNDVGMVVASTKAPSGAQLIAARGIAGAQAFSRLGIVGASYSVIAASDYARLRTLAKAVCEKYTSGIPYSHKAGAFADSPENSDIRRTYLMNTAGISEKEVDDWISLAKAFGAGQIDFHGGHSFRFGDFLFDPEKYPEGRRSMKRVIDRLHEAGLQAGLHTYAEFISPYSDYVTPKPHPELAGRLYTLADDIGLSCDYINIVESTEGVNSITGFFVQNSAHLVIDDEIIRFDVAGSNGFKIAARGECGTSPAPHKKGARVKHLMQEFGLFVPDGDSELLLDVARRTAEVYNECGFDMIYLDAIDGTDCVKDSGSDEGLTWYYANRFVSEIMRNVRKEPILEMSAMWHHFWYYRSRMGAWDHSIRSHKALLAEHNASNLRSRAATFLPQNFGWWTYGRVDRADPVQTQRMYSEDYEYFSSRALKNDWSLAFTLSLEAYRESEELRRFVAMIKRYEARRLEGSGGELPEGECHMTTSGDIVPIEYFRAPGRLTFNVGDNAKLTKLRIENMPLALKDKKLTLLSPSDSPLLSLYSSTTVEASCSESTDEASGRRYIGLKASQRGALGYARFEKRYNVLFDAHEPRAVGFWLCGDGKGEKLDIQLISPKAELSGSSDFCTTIDFTGWKYFLMYNPNPELLSEDILPFSGGGHYNDPPYRPEFDIAKEVEPSQIKWHPSRRDVGIYMLARERINWKRIESISLVVCGIGDGGSCEIRLGEVEAFALGSERVDNSSIEINRREIKLRGSLAPFDYIELCDGESYAFDASGNRIDCAFETPLPDLLAKGDNVISAHAGERLVLTAGVSGV